MKTKFLKPVAALVLLLGFGAALDAQTYIRTIVGSVRYKGPVLFEQEVTMTGNTGTLAGADVTASDDVTVGDDLTVGDDAAVTGDLAVTGTTTLAGIVNASNLSSTANLVRFYTGSKTLTNAGGAETVFTLTNATLQGSGAVVRYRILATDGTDHQVRTGVAQFGCVNKAGTTTAGIAPADETGSAVAASTGTLPYALTAGTAANACTFLVNVNTSLTATSIVMFWVADVFGPGTIS